MDGFKGFNHDWTCKNDFQYGIDQKYTMKMKSNYVKKDFIFVKSQLMYLDIMT
jgi:hypothetical protein